MKRRRLRTVTAFLLLVGAFAVGRRWLDSVGGPETLREQFGLWGLAVSFPLHVGAVVSFGGEEFIAMANGLTYGILIGSAVTWLGWYTGSFIQFGMGRMASTDFDLARRVDRMPAWLRRFPVSHPCFIIFARWLLPGIGGHVATLLPGAAGVALGRYAWCTAIGTALPSIGWTFAGLQLAGR